MRLIRLLLTLARLKAHRYLVRLSLCLALLAQRQHRF